MPDCKYAYETSCDQILKPHTAVMSMSTRTECSADFVFCMDRHLSLRVGMALHNEAGFVHWQSGLEVFMVSTNRPPSTVVCSGISSRQTSSKIPFSSSPIVSFALWAI